MEAARQVAGAQPAADAAEDARQRPTPINAPADKANAMTISQTDRDLIKQLAHRLNIKPVGDGLVVQA
jgi:hypothetical protein